MSDSTENTSPAKRLKPDDGTGDGNCKQSAKFTGFQVKRVLNENSQKKMMCVMGEFPGSTDSAVVVLEKNPFTEDDVRQVLGADTEHSVNFENDIYASYQLYPSHKLNGVKASLVYPATEKHIIKYSSQTVYLLEETPEDYKNITLPYIESSQFSIQWVHNILSKKKESERIVFEDTDPETGFILLPDMKWDGKTMEEMYLVAIVHQHDVRSLRELNDKHLPLLKNIWSKGTKALKDKYGVPPCQLRVYVHYQPSYYHLHVHFTHIRFDAPGSGVERAHLLSDIINNIELDSQYYSKKSLTFPAKENDALYKAFKEAGRIDEG